MVSDFTEDELGQLRADLIKARASLLMALLSDGLDVDGRDAWWAGPHYCGDCYEAAALPGEVTEADEDGVEQRITRAWGVSQAGKTKRERADGMRALYFGIALV